jgi:hypothetical protein
MSDFSTKTPIEQEKISWLHDRSVRPVRSPVKIKSVGIIILAVLTSIALIALAFQARASWDVARDWVVPGTVPLFAVAGVCLVHLLVRRAFRELTPALVFLGLVVIFTILNLVRSGYSDGSDAMRDSFSILTGIFLALTVVSSVIAALAVELRRPVKVSLPEA